jgi:hypothetical protein
MRRKLYAFLATLWLILILGSRRSLISVRRPVVICCLQRLEVLPSDLASD